jgi:putative transposase
LPSPIVLSPSERNTLLDYYRRDGDPAVRLRAHILLLLADEHSWSLITTVLFCSTRTIARWQKRFHQGGLPALFGQPRGARPRYGRYWLNLVVQWFTTCSPQVFGFFRSRWTCALAVLLLHEDYRLNVSQETVRRWLHRGGLVWRRPRPVLKRRDPRHDEIMAGLRTLLHKLPPDETVVFMDEVDINLNPDIGLMWMRRGQQAEIVTPGDNKKNYLAGSLHWRTGAVLAPVLGAQRNGVLVARHLDELCRRLRRYRVIHVLWDNAKIHDCAAVNRVLARHGARLRVHALPKYAPKCNPVERVWWHLREEITRNHRCQTLEELIELVLGWLDGSYFVVEDSVYQNQATRPPKTKVA